jgi:transcriptional regulator with XRE-family HTH domain
MKQEDSTMKQVLSIADQFTPILQAARNTAGLSQTELAERLSLSQSRASAMKLDLASIRLDQFLTICSALHLELVVQVKSAPGSMPEAWLHHEWSVMGRPSHSRTLSVWSNGQRVGNWTFSRRGEHTFQLRMDELCCGPPSFTFLAFHRWTTSQGRTDTEFLRQLTFR